MTIELSTLLWCLAGATIFIAGLTQGALGFGFPAISTPVLALITDIKTAVILNLLDRKSTRLNSSHVSESRMPSSA